MHALGFYHEHQRPDRDRFVYFDEKNMTSNCLNAFKLIQMNSHKQKSDGESNQDDLPLSVNFWDRDQARFRE